MRRRWRSCVARDFATGGASRAVPHRHIDRHAERPAGRQRPRRRRNAGALRRRQQRLRRHEASVRRRPRHQYAAVAGRRVARTTQGDLLHAHAFGSHRGLRRHHAAALDYNSTGPKLDVVCSADAVSPLGFTISCRKFVAHIGDAFLQSGEIAQRHTEDKARLAAARRIDQCRHLRANERAAGRLDVR